MFDNIVSNKYLIIALIIALIVVIYLYMQKRSCEVEGMKNIDLTPLPHQLSEKPWVNNNNNNNNNNSNNSNNSNNDNDNKYKTNGNKFDKNADAIAKKRYGNNKQLKRADEIYNIYVDSDDELQNPNKIITGNRRKQQTVHRRRSTINGIPQPLDMRPDLGPCQPCICPGDSDSTSDDKPKRKRTNNKKSKKN